MLTAWQADGDLSFNAGDRIELVEKTDSAEDWWTGKLNGVQGVFPGKFKFVPRLPVDWSDNEYRQLCSNNIRNICHIVEYIYVRDQRWIEIANSRNTRNMIGPW